MKCLWMFGDLWQTADYSRNIEDNLNMYEEVDNKWIRLVNASTEFLLRKTLSSYIVNLKTKNGNATVDIKYQNFNIMAMRRLRRELP